jgi:hypothetical protein
MMQGTRRTIVTAAASFAVVLGVGGVAAATSGHGSHSPSDPAPSTTGARHELAKGPVRLHVLEATSTTPSTVDEDASTATPKGTPTTMEGRDPGEDVDEHVGEDVGDDNGHDHGEATEEAHESATAEAHEHERGEVTVPAVTGKTTITVDVHSKSEDGDDTTSKTDSGGDDNSGSGGSGHAGHDGGN